MDLSAIRWYAVLTAAFSSFVIGAIWYGPLLGKAWMRVSGLTREEVARAPMGRVLGGSFALQLTAAVVLAAFIGADATLSFAILAAASVGLFWVAPSLGVISLFEQRPRAHWAINAGYHVVAFSTMGLILGVWR
jgi:hypothetical protein